MERSKTIAVLCAIALAVIVPLCVAAKAMMDRAAYPLVKVEIEPYDPRDLFYGHYMRYGYKWNWDGNKPDEGVCRGAECCLCLGKGDTDPPVSLVACAPKEAAPENCAHRLRGIYTGQGRFDVGHGRYFLDERIALPLEHLFMDRKARFHVGLMIAPDGTTILERLYVDGMLAEEFVDAGGLEEKTPDIQ